MVGDGAEHRRDHGDDEHGDADGEAPEARALRAADDLALEVGRVDRQQYHGGIGRVTEVVEVPCPPFAPQRPLLQR